MPNECEECGNYLESEQIKICDECFNEKKCPECNWETETLVRATDSEEGTEFICSNCYVDRLVENGVLEVKK